MPAPPDPSAPSGRRAQLLDDRVEVLDLLPEVADVVPAERLRDAGPSLRAAVLRVRRGRWDAPCDSSMIGAGLGFLVLEGALVRCVTLAHRTAGELFGPGDVLRPPRVLDDDPPFGCYWRSVTETRVAVLDERFSQAAAAVPELAGALIASATRRTGRIARQLVVAQSQSIDVRILTTLHQLAERWGVMTRDGVVLPEFLSHGTIAVLLGARRPSVTTAMARLTTSGALRRRDDGRWLLIGDLETVAGTGVRALRPARPRTRPAASGEELGAA